MKMKMKVKKSCVPSKRGIVVRGEWKPVNVDPSLFSDPCLDGLVCFEELTDYSLVEPEKTIHVDESVKKTRSDRKRKPREEQLKAEDDDDTDRKKKKKLMTDDEASVDEEEMSQDHHTPQTTSTLTKQENKKKRKKKKKKKVRSEGCEVKRSDGGDVGTAPSKNKKSKNKNWSDAAQADAESRNADVSAWKDLFVPDAVLKALSKLGFSAPTPIQALAIPPAVRDHLDVLGAAETGSGKTLSFAIPMIHMILEWRKGSKQQQHQSAETRVESINLPSISVHTDSGSGADDEDDDDDPVKDDDDAPVKEDDDEGVTAGIPEAHERPLLGLILTPTRELAVQVKHHIDAVAQFTGIKTAIVVGGMAPQKQQRMLMRRPEIVIATPGRLWEMIKERHPHLQKLRQLRCLVIDEADRMVEKGHFSELESLLEMLNTSQFNPKRQTFIFSATLTMVHGLPLRLQQKKKKKKKTAAGRTEQRSKLQLLMEKVGMKDKPKIIDLTRKEATVETLTETRIICSKEEKDFSLYYFLRRYPGRTMVFANSIDCIKRLNALLLILDCSPLALHANMHQKQRLKNLERFAEKDSCVLLTTDVAARGLDVPNVQHVIHYQVPRTSETYVHRSGRTARATKEGLSLLLIGPDDLINYKKICRTLEKDEDLPVFPIEARCMTAIKERVNLARKIEKMEYFHGREKQHNSWVRQAAEALDIDVEDDLLLGQGKDDEEDRHQQKLVKVMKKQLKHMISQPVFRNTMKTKYPTQMGKLQLPQAPVTTATAALTSFTHHKQTARAQRKYKP
ncbi:ATP-dependent RNA helicase DDX24 [Triplophysa dalaica]|uniref:ATP-dependent RNA helicase DDX24 n=1 Tax=Triplophysa dalaica TaxID=1582913 RepID=UPI0024DF4793|nr:ATP-dependent RNA helicase DDX24 [Triplophysa dalaica]XP_056623123.1 ATP-dependent RNA helicase DDX24 [Triplophysa dalaica]XP_056623124.1 ATP-dependent RNA helicase DDX24 [Triplophysa dalaica]XP_056623125.1 ATP-dependent RNA helicase DDX24 [Triplophysa dalaica]